MFPSLSACRLLRGVSANKPQFPPRNSELLQKEEKPADVIELGYAIKSDPMFPANMAYVKGQPGLQSWSEIAAFAHWVHRSFQSVRDLTAATPGTVRALEPDFCI